MVFSSILMQKNYKSKISIKNVLDIQNLHLSFKKLPVGFEVFTKKN